MSLINVTVIVPVYKAEKYLRRCVDSILIQTNGAIEVILINDGSPDNCPEICDEYMKLDNRVTVIHKVNGGSSSARNAGLKIAKGEYIMFVDADDYIEPKSIEYLYKNAKNNNLDISIGSITIEGRPGFKSSYSTEFYEKIWTGEQYLIYREDRGRRGMVVWIGLFRTKLIIDNEIYFKNGIMHEDELWVPMVLLKAKRIKVIRYLFYHYNNLNFDSVTRKSDLTKNGQDLIIACSELDNLFTTVENKHLKKIMMDHVAQLYIYAIIGCGLFKRNASKRIDNSFLKNKAYYKKTKRKVFFFRVSRRLYFLIHKLKESTLLHGRN